jgi:hypothetical protein
VPHPEATRLTKAGQYHVSDFLNAPAVDEIDLPAYTGKTGESIRLQASADMEVRGVTVAIRAQNEPGLGRPDDALTLLFDRVGRRGLSRAVIP